MFRKLAPGGTGSPRQEGRTRRSSTGLLTGAGVPCPRLANRVTAGENKLKKNVQAVSAPTFCSRTNRYTGSPSKNSVFPTSAVSMSCCENPLAERGVVTVAGSDNARRILRLVREGKSSHSSLRAPNGVRLSCGAEREYSQTEFYPR